MDPSVSLPIAKPTSPAAVADAGPADDPSAFIYRGRGPPSPRPAALSGLGSPYLRAQAAQAAFAEAGRLARAHGRTHRDLFLPATANGRAAVARFWARLQPKETLVVAGDDGELLGPEEVDLQ